MPWRSRDQVRQRVPWRSRTMQLHPHTCVLFSNPPERMRLNLGIPFWKQGRRVPSEGVPEPDKRARRSRHRKARPREQLLENRVQIRANRRLGVVEGVRIWVLFAKQQHAKKQTQQNPSSGRYQSGASQISERYAKTEPPPIVDLPEMKSLLATSTTFLHAKRHKKIAIHLIDLCMRRFLRNTAPAVP